MSQELLTEIEKINTAISVNEKSIDLLNQTRRLNTLNSILVDENIVIALGTKFFIKPRVEIYINGKLEFIFETKIKKSYKLVIVGIEADKVGKLNVTLRDW